MPRYCSNSKGEVVGRVGVRGDVSCADYNIARKKREYLQLDYGRPGVADDGAEDNIVCDIVTFDGIAASAKISSG